MSELPGIPSFESDEHYLPELAEFVAIPSMSRDSREPDMRAAAQWLAGQPAFANGRMAETDGNPVVFGEGLGAPRAPTVLVCGHYYVQPTGSLAEWHTPPFDLTAALEMVYSGEKVIYARIGGTLPATVLFKEVLDATTLFFSFSIADQMLHAPNEYIRVHRLGEGMRAWSELWRLLGNRAAGEMSASAWAASSSR